MANTNGGYFGGGSNIFDTEQGLIACTRTLGIGSWQWHPDEVPAVARSSHGVSLLLNGTFLLAANFNSGKVDVYDRNFGRIILESFIGRSKTGAGLAPHALQESVTQSTSAYAMQEGPRNAIAEAGLGRGR